MGLGPGPSGGDVRLAVDMGMVVGGGASQVPPRTWPEPWAGAVSFTPRV